MEETSLTSADAYEGWAIVELMGHRVIAGKVSEASQYGAAMLRVDVPNGDGETAITQFYGGSAIYALTPCDEAAARKVLNRRWDLPEPVRLALPEPAREPANDNAALCNHALGDGDDPDDPDYD